MTLSDSLPANTSFVSASDGGAFNGGVVTWNIGSVAAGRHADRHRHGRGQRRHSGRRDPDRQHGLGPGRRQQRPGLQPRQQHGRRHRHPRRRAGPGHHQDRRPDQRSAGQTLTYTLTVTNVGTAGRHRRRRHRHPARPYAFGQRPPEHRPASRRVLTLDVGNLEPGRQVTLHVTVLVDSAVPAGVTAITNEASVRDDGTNGPDPTPLNNTAIDTDTLVAAPDLHVTKTDHVARCSAGADAHLHPDHHNAGNQAATGVLSHRHPARQHDLRLLQRRRPLAASRDLDHRQPGRGATVTRLSKCR